MVPKSQVSGIEVERDRPDLFWADLLHQVTPLDGHLPTGPGTRVRPVDHENSTALLVAIEMLAFERLVEALDEAVGLRGGMPGAGRGGARDGWR